MVTLALDTSTRTGGCAVLSGDTVMADVAGDAARSHAERLPSDLMTVLQHGGVSLADVDVFAVAVGPGSFTGLRVGIATMQGLALAAGRPLVGVSVLDALARVAATGAERRSVDTGRRVATWVEAWRGEIYAALYDDGAIVESATVERPEQVLARLNGHRTFFIGDGAAVHAEAIRSAMGPQALWPATVEPALAGVIGWMAAAEVDAGRRPAPDEIQPLYVRRPDVEIAREGHGQR
jgi:tRNA threonylcarbamoyladenosine biosynthesis protein TsaB